MAVALMPKGTSAIMGTICLPGTLLLGVQVMVRSSRRRAGVLRRASTAAAGPASATDSTRQTCGAGKARLGLRTMCPGLRRCYTCGGSAPIRRKSDHVPWCVRYSQREACPPHFPGAPRGKNALPPAGERSLRAWG